MRLDFDLKAYADMPDFVLAPDGDYGVECVELKEVIAKAQYKMLRAEFEILDPPDSNTGHVWEYFLIGHPDLDKREKARKSLAKWARAAGLVDLEDITALEHSQCRVTLGTAPGSGDYGPTNKIRKFLIEENGRGAPKSDSASTESDGLNLKDEVPF